MGMRMSGFGLDGKNIPLEKHYYRHANRSCIQHQLVHLEISDESKYRYLLNKIEGYFIKYFFNQGIMELGLDKRRNFYAAANGAVAVEFAILIPLYLLLILGMTAYGIYFGASHSVQQISADAARVAISGLTEAERQALATDFVARNAQDYLFITPNRLSVNVADSPKDANQFVVQLTYDASGLPIWGLFDGLSLPGQTIRRSSTIRIGGI